jgi:prepilin-type processing-associated H-X9-DG protein
MGLALHNFNDTYKHFPDAGEGTYYVGGTANPTTLFNQPSGEASPAQSLANGGTSGPVPTGQIGGWSVFAHLLPYMEQTAVYSSIDFTRYYNSTAQTNVPGTNYTGPQTVIPSYLCPSNPLRPSSGLDSAGFGYTDYGATVYTDVDPNYVAGGTIRNKATRLDGALSGPRKGNLFGGGSTVGSISDGLSNTIAIAEDVGRNEQMPGAYPDPLIGGSTMRSFWRWAEPDNGYGVSGPPNQGPSGPANANQVINNNFIPTGGPVGCVWNTTTNCGANDEIFSFHGGGANVLFMDGHVSFLNEKTNPVIIRFLVTAAEGIPVNAADY